MQKKQFEKLYNDLQEEMNLQSSYTACATGYRPQNCPWGFNEKDLRCLKMKKRVTEKVEIAINNGYKIFITGMALGFDTIFAEIILELKKKYPYIKLVAALPCKNQYKFWNLEQVKRYKKILSSCDLVRCLYDNYNNKCMLDRNNYMLNNSSLVFALYDGKPGGTKYTVKKAVQKNIKIEYIKP